MKVRLCVWRFLWLCAAILLLSGSSRAQFTGNIQGVVEDPSGATVAQAKIVLVNLANQISTSTTSDTSGNYRFLSLAPGSYKVTTEATGFSKAEVTVTLETNQTLNVPISLKVGAAIEAVTVTGEAGAVTSPLALMVLPLADHVTAEL